MCIGAHFVEHLSILMKIWWAKYKSRSHLFQLSCFTTIILICLNTLFLLLCLLLLTFIFFGLMEMKNIHPSKPNYFCLIKSKHFYSQIKLFRFFVVQEILPVSYNSEHILMLGFPKEINPVSDQLQSISLM